MARLSQRSFEGTSISFKVGETPPEIVRQVVSNNIQSATKYIKEDMVKKIKDRLAGGVDGQTYNSRWAMIKSLLTGKSYGTGGPVDLRHSGFMLDALEGRGRARPSKGTTRVWANFRRDSRQGRAEYPHWPGGKVVKPNITNSQLADILNGVTPHGKRDSRNRKPLALHEEEADEVLESAIKRLFKDL